MAGEFEQLLPFKWRDLHLPIFKVGLSLAHDLVEHKYWGVNGARVEATGVAPIRISAVIPIANSIYPGKTEKWQAGSLYPDMLRKFIVEFAKKETGYVQHPEFGEIACKPERMEFELVGERQDSTQISASWVETLDDDVVTKINLRSPVLDLDQAAADLAASRASLKKLVPQLPEFQESLESLGRKLTSVVDQVAVLQYRGAGILNRIIYQAHRLEVAIERVATNRLGQVTSLRPGQSQFKKVLKAMSKLNERTTVGTGPIATNSRPQQQALTWPAIQALQQVQASAYSMRRSLLSDGGIGLYTVPSQMTVAGVALSLPKGTSVATVIKMNPSLARGPVVSKGTVIRYPLPK
jgi:hypothetical protein